MPDDRERLPAAASDWADPPGLDLAGHAPHGDFDQAAAAVLADLRGTVGFRFWAATRLTGQTYVIAVTGPDGFLAGPGEQLSWTDTLCRQVLQGRAPRVAPDAGSVPAYRDLPLVQQWRVGSYLSAPLTLDGSTLYGTVCALDPNRSRSRSPTRWAWWTGRPSCCPRCSSRSCRSMRRCGARSARRLRR